VDVRHRQLPGAKAATPPTSRDRPNQRRVGVCK
jgi:hypothetical protein